MTIGVPIKLLHEAQGHIVSVEINNGYMYRGKLYEDALVTTREGKNYHLEQVYIRGSNVRFFIVPDMLKNAPMFKRLAPNSKGRSLPTGRTKCIL